MKAKTPQSNFQSLRLVAKFLHDMDEDLRKITCEKCGKPVSGVIFGPYPPTPEHLSQFCQCNKESPSNAP
jgi:hypothetical protein